MTTATTAAEHLPISREAERERRVCAAAWRCPERIVDLRAKLGPSAIHFQSEFDAAYRAILALADRCEPFTEAALIAECAKQGSAAPESVARDVCALAESLTGAAPMKAALRRADEILRDSPITTAREGVTREAVTVNLADVVAEEVSWLWPSRFALGKISLLVGDPSVGKSFLTCALAATVSRGAPWPDGSGNAPRGSVVMLNAEDGLADTIKPRLVAAGADCSKVVALQAVAVRDEDGREVETGFTLADVAALESAIVAAGDCKLVCIDPVSAYMGGTDSHVNAEVRGLLKPLGDLAQKQGVAVVIVSHLNKGQAAAMYRTSGSLAFVAAARAAWCCVADGDDPKRRKMLCLKNNLAPDAGGMGYIIENGCVQWTGRDFTRASEALAAPRETGDAVSEATEFLRMELALGGKPANEVLRAARAAGHCERTVREAKTRAKVRSVRVAGAWQWTLPAAELTDDELGAMADKHAEGDSHAA